MQQVWKLVLSAGNVEDIAYNGFNYLAVKVDGEWTDGAYNNRCQPWNEQQLTKIVFDYTGNCEIGLKKMAQSGEAMKNSLSMRNTIKKVRR